MRYLEGGSSTSSFTPEKVKGELALNKKELSFTATSSEKCKMGAIVQACIFITGKMKISLAGADELSMWW